MEQKKSGWRIAMEIIIEIIVLIACLIYEAGAWVITQLTNYAASKPRATAWTLIVLTAVAITGWWPRTTSPEYPSGDVKQSSEIRVAPVPERISSSSHPTPKPKATVVKPKITVKVPKVPQPKMPIRAKARGPLTGVLIILDPGHGGVTKWQTADPGCSWTFKGQTLREAAYTYRMAKEVAEMALALGADVAYTSWSPTMNVSAPASVAMPLPVSPRLPSGSILVNDIAGLKARVIASNSVFQKNKSAHKLVLFVSLHVDSQGAGQRGLHVCYDKHADSTPRLATLMSRAISNYSYGWHKGNKPMATIKPQGILVINGKYNVLRHRVLLEAGIPGDDGDSWRLRNEANRRLMLKRVVISPAVQLAKEQKGG